MANWTRKKYPWWHRVWEWFLPPLGFVAIAGCLNPQYHVHLGEQHVHQECGVEDGTKTPKTEADTIRDALTKPAH